MSFVLVNYFKHTWKLEFQGKQAVKLHSHVHIFLCKDLRKILTKGTLENFILHIVLLTCTHGFVWMCYVGNIYQLVPIIFQYGSI